MVCLNLLLVAVVGVWALMLLFTFVLGFVVCVTCSFGSGFIWLCCLGVSCGLCFLFMVALRYICLMFDCILTVCCGLWWFYCCIWVFGL